MNNYITKSLFLVDKQLSNNANDKLADFENKFVSCVYSNGKTIPLCHKKVSSKNELEKISIHNCLWDKISPQAGGMLNSYLTRLTKLKNIIVGLPYCTFCYVKNTKDKDKDHEVAGCVFDLQLNPSDDNLVELWNRIQDFRMKELSDEVSSFRLFFLPYESENSITGKDTNPVIILYGENRAIQKINCSSLKNNAIKVIKISSDISNNSKTNIIRNDIESIGRVVGISDYSQDILVVFYVPSLFNVTNARTGLQFAIGISYDNVTEAFDKNLPELIFDNLTLFTRSWGLAIERQLLALEIKERFDSEKKLLRKAYTQSAIGSIMSRNGSHNIGSHVLSALSHHVGTMPDDRMLYQYIQHRMDYIATATTDFPQWTTPTMFVGGLMKNFYSQKHLLDYISHSEGLRAYKFQERNLDDATRMNQHGTIRVFLRRLYDLEQKQTDLPTDHRYLTYDPYGQAWSVYYFFGEKNKMFRQKFSKDKRTEYEISESGGIAKFLEYDGKMTPDWKQDVRMAIPGGIVGQHAFYTIIENVIRNAAKHGWASEKNLNEKDLEIFIDFWENTEKDKIIFKIWDNVSDIFESAIEFWNKFFLDFSCPIRENHIILKGWHDFLTNHQDLASLIENECQKEDEHNENECQREDEYNEDECKNCWHLLWDYLSPKQKDELELDKDIPKENAFKLEKLLLNVFVNPLNFNEAKKLEEYLDEKNNADDSKLPLIYRIQKLYLQDQLNGLNIETWEWEKFLSSKGKNSSSGLGNRLILPLHHDQQRKLAQSFIDLEGKLRKENWGLAEMKISAGYLAQRNIQEIGGLEEKGNDIVIPVAMPGICRNADNPNNCLSCSDKNKMSCYNSDPNCPLKKHKYHLGYQFKIDKPKDILIVLDENEYNEIKTLNFKKFNYQGIFFAIQHEENGNYSYEIVKSETYREKLDKFNYRYVVLPDLKYLRSEFCFRQIERTKVNNGKFWDLIRNAQDNEFIELRKKILSAWIRDVAKKCQHINNQTVKLIVNVDGNESGSERGLVTKKDLLQTMFVECYHTALIEFLKNPPSALNLSDTTRRVITLLSLIRITEIKDPQQDYSQEYGNGAKTFIRDQLIDYCNLLKSELLLSKGFVEALKSIEKYVKDNDGKGDAVIARKIEDINNAFEKSIAHRLFRGKQDEDDEIKRGCEDLVTYLQNVDKVDLDNWLDTFHGDSKGVESKPNSDSYLSGRHSFEDNLRAIVNACSEPEEVVFNALVESLNSMFLASDVYLRKYEERIATLPEAYKNEGNTNFCGKESNNKTISQLADELMLPDSYGTNNQSGKIIKYSRHDKAKPKDAIYAEALSGSQSYLNGLSRVVYPSGDDSHGERYASVARLLENAFLRILIIDERVMNFVKEHSSDEMITRFINMGIWIANVEKEGAPKASSEVKDELYEFHHFRNGTNFVDISFGEFDILVIHQGIIDKWWESHDSKKVKKILNELQRVIPKVVVTTGRGRPENIPEDEKVLPFSIIESSLFKLYPEKLIFVNTIMNLLPYGKQD